MNSPRVFWRQWAETLRHYQLQGIAASLLDAGGPLTLLASQILHVGSGIVDNEQVHALANMLEEADEADAFAAYLTQEQIE